MLRNKAHNTDPLWHVQLILLGAIGVQLLLPDAGLPLPRYGLITLELLLMLTLQIVTPKKAVFSSALRRFVVILLIALIALTNVAALQHLVSSLLNNGHIAPQNLLISALNVYLTTSVIFALLYWEMDGGGPGQRRVSDLAIRDFLFPQQNITEFKNLWHPTYIDYLYVSLTNMTAFSPTDTLPLSRRAKLLMAVQSVISLATIVLIAARAINTL